MISHVLRAACGLGIVLAAAAAHPAVTDPSQAGEPVAVLEASFASIGGYVAPCEELPLDFRGETEASLPADLRQQLLTAAGLFDAQRLEVDRLRRGTEGARDAMRLEILRVLRLVEESSAKLAADFETGAYLSALWHAAELTFNASQTEKDASQTLIEYYWWLWDLTAAEQTLRGHAATYYKLIATIYPSLSPVERARALGFLRARMSCLGERRREVFCILARDGREFWQNLDERAWSLVVGDAGRTAVDDLDPGCGREPTTQGAIPDPVAELCDAFLSSVLLHEEYAWLAPETTTTLDILTTLLEREEYALASSELNRQIDLALTSGSGRNGSEWLAYQPLSEATRLHVFALRVERARMVLERKLLALEAGSRKQTSMMLGLGEAFSKAWQQGAVVGQGVATSEGMKAMEPQLQALALVAITQKLLGDSLSLMITTPIQDALTEVAFKPVWGLFGEEVKTSVEKAWDAHSQQVAVLERQEALLADLLEHIHSSADATPYVEAFARGEPMSSPIGQRAPTTVRSLLEDADFVAATKGGLPWLFEVFAEGESQRVALLVHGAAFELEANNRVAVARVAAMRGLEVENPDLRITRASLESIFSPGEAAPSLVGSFDQVISCFPVVGDLWKLYNLPAKVVLAVEYLKGNIQDQDDYLEARVGLQQSLQFVITALDAVDYDYDRMRSEWPWFRVHATDHQALLDRSSEYASAYRLIRYHQMELEKRLVVARHRDPARGALAAEAKTSLTAIQSRQDLECADLAVRGAYAKLVYHALSGNYAAAAVQTRSIEQLEATRRKLLGVEPSTIDLSGVIHAFEAEATRRELVEIYRGLYESAIKDTVLSLATDAMADTILANLADRYGVSFAVADSSVDPFAKIYEQLNPWAGLFSAEGVFNTLHSGLEGAAKNTTAQVLAGKQHVFSEADIEGAIDLVYGVARDVAQNVRERPIIGSTEQVLDRCEDEARGAAIAARLVELEAFQRNEIEPLLRRLDAIGDDPDHEFQREQLVRQIAERRAALQLDAIGEELAALTADAAESRERRLAAEDEVEEAAVGIAAMVVEVEARNRNRDAVEGSDTEQASAHTAAAATSFAHLRSETVGVEDLRGLLDNEHPSRPRAHLLREEGINITTIRNALVRAKENHPDREAEIDAIARDLDEVRIRTVQDLLEEFMRTSELADRVITVVQGGAAEGNPEYRGIFGDIDFTVFVVPDDTLYETGDGEEKRLDDLVKLQLQAFFEDRGFPLATPDKPSSMDTETFVQPIHLLDPAITADGTLIVDTAIKRKDATRFYSEGGGKWAMNNYAYSGKVLLPPYDRHWTPAEPREGYGLAVDMARHLGFLTDPRNTRTSLAAMTTEQRVEQLDTVLKDSKYFLRLVDAYLIGHEGLGNRLYNNRMAYRQEEGEDASYHAQIAKDVEALVSPLGGDQTARLAAVTAGLDSAELARARQSIFSQGDVDFIHQLARIKQKGANPDPWAVLDGESMETKAEAAEAMVSWMQSMAPRILAEVGDVWRRGYERAVQSGDEQEARAVRSDARRIATTVAAVTIYDSVGTKSLLHPPARVLKRTDANGQTRLVDLQLSSSDHEEAIRLGIEADRTRRQRLLDEIAVRQDEVRRLYPPDDELSDEDRQALREAMQAIYNGVQGREENIDEDNPMYWLMFWLRR